jgi:hypothetical protein
MSLTFDKQLRLKSIIDSLVYAEGRTYDVALGKELRDIVVDDCRLKPVSSLQVSIEKNPVPIKCRATRSVLVM